MPARAARAGSRRIGLEHGPRFRLEDLVAYDIDVALGGEEVDAEELRQIARQAGSLVQPGWRVGRARRHLARAARATRARRRGHRRAHGQLAPRWPRRSVARRVLPGGIRAKVDRVDEEALERAVEFLRDPGVFEDVARARGLHRRAAPLPAEGPDLARRHGIAAARRGARRRHGPGQDGPGDRAAAARAQAAGGGRRRARARARHVPDVADRQLAARARPLRAGADRARPSRADARGACLAARRPRRGGHELRAGRARPRDARRHRLDRADLRRGAVGEEPRHRAGPRGTPAARARARRTHRYADGEPAARAVVDPRPRQPGPARHGHRLQQALRGTDRAHRRRGGCRHAARADAPVHAAPRQARSRDRARPAREAGAHRSPARSRPSRQRSTRRPPTRRWPRCAAATASGAVARCSRCSRASSRSATTRCRRSATGGRRRRRRRAVRHLRPLRQARPARVDAHGGRRRGRPRARVHAVRPDGAPARRAPARRARLRRARTCTVACRGPSARSSSPSSRPRATSRWCSCSRSRPVASAST